MVAKMTLNSFEDSWILEQRPFLTQRSYRPPKGTLTGPFLDHTSNYLIQGSRDGETKWLAASLDEGGAVSKGETMGYILEERDKNAGQAEIIALPLLGYTHKIIQKNTEDCPLAFTAHLWRTGFWFL